MTVRLGDNLGLGSGYAAGDNGWGTQMNSNLRMLDTLGFLTVRVAPQENPPGSPALGDRYMVGGSPTGAWSAKPNSLAVWTEDETNTQLWQFMVPKDGWQCYVVPTDGSAVGSYMFRNGTWAPQVSPYVNPVDFYSYAPGTLTASQVLLSVDCLRPITFPANLAGATVNFDVAATANATLTITHAGSSIGIITVPAGSTSGTVSGVAAFTTSTHDNFSVGAPVAPDTTLAGARIAITGTR